MLGLSLKIGLKLMITATSRRLREARTTKFVSSVTLVRAIDRNLRRNLRKTQT